MTRKLLIAGIISIILMCGAYIIYLDNDRKNSIDSLERIVYTKDIEIERLNTELANTKSQLTLTEENLRVIKQKHEEAVSRGSSRKITLEATAYTHTGNVTASGRYPVAGRTVASNDFPLGTRLKINGNIYIVEDTGNMGSGVVDIFMDTHNECVNWGRQVVTVEVL